MLTATEYKIVAKREYCAVCHSPQLEALLDLPGLPLTGVFSKKPMTGKPKGVDQKFLFCPKCCHGQLAYEVDPAHIYNETYGFRTSLSVTARAGTEFFLDFLKSMSPQQGFDYVLDVGCNDLHLLKQFKGKVQTRVGIDPIWASQVLPDDVGDIVVIGESIENSNLLKRINQRPDLILCRHTLEHIYDPLQMLEQLMEIATDDALFVFEVPGFDTLVGRSRFDQIFHQHLQYFSLFSFCQLMSKMGLHLLDCRINYHDWGAMAVAFSKGEKLSADKNIVFNYEARSITERFRVFQKHLEQVSAVLDSYRDTVIYGYGASAMLPVLSYHMKQDLSLLRAVLDDDKNRNGLYYWNLPLKIQHISQVENLEEANIILTAVDSTRPILTKLFLNRPKNIIYPLEAI